MNIAYVVKCVHVISTFFKLVAHFRSMYLLFQLFSCAVIVGNWIVVEVSLT